jgi:hypothetical protein
VEGLLAFVDEDWLVICRGERGMIRLVRYFYSERCFISLLMRVRVGEGWKRKVNGINQGRTYDQSSRSYSIFLPSSPQQLCTSPPFPLSLLSPNISQPLNYLQEVMYPSPLQIPLSISPSYASIIIPTPNSKKVKVMYHHLSSSVSS